VSNIKHNLPAPATSLRSSQLNYIFYKNKTTNNYQKLPELYEQIIEVTGKE